MVSETWHLSLVKYRSTYIDESLLIYSYEIMLVANAYYTTYSSRRAGKHQRMIIFGTSTFLLLLVMMTLVFGNGENMFFEQEGVEENVEWGRIMQ